jgi:hypothetical protein
MEVQFVKIIEEDAAGNRGDAVGMVILYTGGGGVWRISKADHGGKARQIMEEKLSSSWRTSYIVLEKQLDRSGHGRTVSQGRES